MNKKLLSTILLSILFSLVTTSQESFSLNEILWNKVKPCYNLFEDEDGDGKVDGAEIIDDSKNGYIKVSGSYPTCGCECSMTIGAFKDIKGEFIFIEFEEYSCSWQRR